MVKIKLNIQDGHNRITGLKSVIENYSSEVGTLIWYVESGKNNLSELDQDIINGNQGNIKASLDSLNSNIREILRTRYNGNESILVTNFMNIEGMYTSLFLDYQKPNSDISKNLMTEVKAVSYTALTSIDGLNTLNSNKKKFDRGKKIFDALAKAFNGPEFSVSRYSGVNYTGSKTQIIGMFKNMNGVSSASSVTQKITNNFSNSLQGKALMFIGIDYTLAAVTEIRNYSFSKDVDDLTGKLINLPVKTAAGILIGTGVNTAVGYATVAVAPDVVSIAAVASAGLIVTAGVVVVVALGQVVVTPVYNAAVASYKEDQDIGAQEAAIKEVDDKWYQDGTSTVQHIETDREHTVSIIKGTQGTWK